MDKTAIEIKNYSFRYNNSEDWVLKDISFTLNYGELMVLSGRSGEGKSTLFSSINRIIPYLISGVQEGEIYIHGENIMGKRPNEISRLIGSILQNADSQIIHSMVEDEIAFGCENMSMNQEKISTRIEEVCDFMDLDKSWSTKTLSGGQKQRLITAAVLAMEQRIIILDEPLANLDLEGAKKLLNLMKSLAAKGYAILLIEHRLDLVLRYADKIGWLDEGRLRLLEKHEVPLDRIGGSNEDKDSRNGIDRTKENDLSYQMDNLSYRIGDKDILKMLNFTIVKGERIVILGENGCGKTTLMRIMARMIHPTSGVLKQKIYEEKKRKPSSEWFKKVGFVYQNPNYQLFMPSVEEEIGFQEKNADMADQILAKLQLSQLKDRHPQSLSEGQKRIVTIGCVMAMEPEVILLDEPTVGQDSKGLKNIIEVLNQIHEAANNTMITVTHDYRCAKELADRILWMKQGKIFKIGGPELADEYFWNDCDQSLPKS